MEPDELDSLNDSKNHLNEFIERAKQAQDAIPWAKRQLENINWELLAAQSRPDEADEIPTGPLSDVFGRDNAYIKAAFPLPPRYDSNMWTRSMVNSTAGTAVMSTYASRVGEIGTPAALKYAGFVTFSYQQLQHKWNDSNGGRNCYE